MDAKTAPNDSNAIAGEVKTEMLPPIMLEDGSRPKVCGEFTTDDLRRVADAVQAPGRGSIYKYAPHPEPPPSYATIGTVYFIGPDGGPVKIGFTTNLKTRLGRLQVGSPAKLKVFAAIHDAPGRLEREYHARFWQCRLHGEWFELTDELSAEIARLRPLSTTGKD